MIYIFNFFFVLIKSLAADSGPVGAEVEADKQVVTVVENTK